MEDKRYILYIHTCTCSQTSESSQEISYNSLHLSSLFFQNPYISLISAT